jgi:4-amino-4-deoxy-L-arabinose transferase-like glycosyltransferase
MSGAARRSLLVLLALLALGCAMFLPNLSSTELRSEEGRRAWPSREMQDGGDPWVPTIYGETYANKPPGHFWLIVAVSELAGREVDELTTRLPSVLATLATMLALWLVLVSARAPTAAWLAALCVLAAPLTYEKATLGEIEAPFVATTFAAGAFAFLALRRAWWWTPLAALALGFALLVKGPPALLALLGAALGAWRDGARPLTVLARALLVLALALLAPALWVERVVDSLGSERAFAIWGGQLARDPPDGWLAIAAHRVEFVLGVVGGCGIAGIALAIERLLGRREDGARAAHSSAWSSPWARAAKWQIAAWGVPFLLHPGSQPRYAQPCVPWVALLAALVLARHFEPRVAAAVPPARRVRWVVPALLALCAACVAKAIWFAPSDADRHGRREAAAVLESALAPGVPLSIHHDEDYNLVFHLGARPRWVDDPAALVPPAQVLVSHEHPSVRALETDPRWRLAAHVTTKKQKQLDLWVGR